MEKESNEIGTNSLAWKNKIVINEISFFFYFSENKLIEILQSLMYIKTVGEIA